ncbi:DUF2690 domain-containing protein [Streptomyces sp. NPDC001732]
MISKIAVRFGTTTAVAALAVLGTLATPSSARSDGARGSNAPAVTTTSAPVAAGTCTFDSPITAKSASVGSATVQLRYSTTTRCAWGRVLNARVGDFVYVERRYPDGHSDAYLPGASATEVKTGSDAHTPSYYDGGVQMRACAVTRTTSNCTGWY